MRNIPSFVIFVLLALFLPALWAQDSKPAAPTPPVSPASSSSANKDKPRPIKDVLPDAKKIEGLLTFYQKKDKLYAEIKGSNLSTDYLIAMAVARGSGTNPVGGYTLQSNGGDWLWQFKKVNDSIQVIRRNIRFKADSGTPEAKAVEIGYSDSILYSLPILATGEGGGDVIDLASIFMSDLPRLGIGSFDRSRSHWGDVKGFANNMEFRVNATYASSSIFSLLGGGSIGGGASPDDRSVGVTMHYSINKLPSTGYIPRSADQRVGYFLVAHKNFSRAAEEDHSIRYITRWNLQKADPSATLSPPKKPIVFWIEKTVPFKYRSAVREGILEWNKAFEKVGIVNAIEVRQQSDSDTWDAEDINYNTFRWITSDAGFAMGPSRVNPMTGELLDADIIFDARFVDSWQTVFDYLIADLAPADTDKIVTPFSRVKAQRDSQHRAGMHHEDHDSSINGCTCNYVLEKAAHFAIASLALAAEEEETAKEELKEGQDESADAKEDKKDDIKEDNDENKDDARDDAKNSAKEDSKKPSKQEKEKERAAKFERLVLAGIKDVVMHEVGHTLGLRHNFQASSWLTLDEMNDPNRSKEFGIAGSVMDYLDINLAPKGKPQGDYFMTTLGPYDYLAIEYGYKILSGGTDGEKKELAKIAARQADKGNNYATDEDRMFGDSIDPRTGVYDLGTDPLAFSKRGLELYHQLLPEIIDRTVKENGPYRKVGAYYLLLLQRRYFENNLLLRNIEGLYRNRDYKGDTGGRLPIQTVDAKTKRESVRFLCENTFGADAFQIAPEIYNQFGTEKWLIGDGSQLERTVSISLGEIVPLVQCYTLESLLSPWMLDALTDTTLRVSEGEEVYTIDELFDTVKASVFSELDTIKEGEFSYQKPAIPRQRMVVQEYYFDLLAFYAMGGNSALDVNASRPLALRQLFILESEIQAAMTNSANWDRPSSAHLSMLRDRIKKLREASMVVGTP